MAIVEVRVDPLGTLGNITYHHAYVLITYDDGRQYYLRGGPTPNSNGSQLDAFGDNSQHTYGNIWTWQGEYLPGTIDHDEELDDRAVTVFSGSDSDVDARLALMQQRLQDIQNANIPYNPLDENSNTVVGELLEAASIPRQLPLDGDGNTTWTPDFFDQLPDGSTNSGLTNVLLDYAKWQVDNALMDVEKLFDILKDYVEEAIDAGRNAIDAAGDVVDALAELTKEKYYDTVEFLNDFFDNVGDWFSDTASDFQAAINAALRRLIDPLVVDMDGDGIELTARADSNVVFDMDGDGVKEWTGWIGKDDAFLVIDENLNGKVDSITELIGDQGRSGFTELSTYDSNGDQTINSSDAIWPKLLLWRDSNSNGTTNTGELLTLTAGDIKSIDLHYTTVNFTAEGNRIHESSIFEKISGGVGALVDAWLDVSNVAQPLGALTTGNVTVDILPNIRNYGDVTTLRMEMVNDTALTTLVNTVVNLQPDQLAGIKGQIEQILFRWANTNDIAIDSRGVNFDGRVLATLEKFLGTPYAVMQIQILQSKQYRV